MAYKRPPLFKRLVLQPLAMRFGIGGFTTLRIAGRRSGRVRSVPVVPIRIGGLRYLVSTRGRSQWVRNLRAAGYEGELVSGNRRERFHATELPLDERPPIIAAYEEVRGAVVKPFFAEFPDPADHPVFRIDPR